MAFTNTYAVPAGGKLTGKGLLTKGADADATITFNHTLGAIPDEVVVSAVSGTEAGWRVSALTATQITVVCSAGAGTANSSCNVLARISHSIIG